MSDLLKRADAFAARAHEGQIRKYTGEPYINHPREVAEIVAKAGYGDEVKAAALLHDVIEDCGVTGPQIAREFGDAVARLVMEVSDVSKPADGNRRVRKAIDRAHLAKASAEGHTIKLADLISNTRTIVDRDLNFAKVYLLEKRALMPLLDRGDETLRRTAMALLEAGEARLRSL